MRRLVPTLCGLAALMLTSLPAQASSKAFTQMVAKLHSLQTYQVTVDGKITVEGVKGDSDTSESFKEHVYFKNPNKIVVSIPVLYGGITIWSDGKNMYQYYGIMNEYKETSVPADLVEYVMTLAMGSAKGYKDAGTTTINGTRVDIVKGPGPEELPGSSMSLYIGSKDHLLVGTMIVAPKASSTGGPTKFVQTYSKPVLNEPIPDNVFDLKLPPTAMKMAGGTPVPGGIGLR